MINYQIELLKDLDQSLLDDFFKHGTIVYCKKNEPIFMGGELEKYFYIVLNGKIKTLQIDIDSSREQTLFIYRKGDMFDTLILLDGKPHDVIYEVLESSELLQLPIEMVREWVYNNPQFNRRFFPYLASQMRYTEELASDLSIYSTAQRLSKLLLQNINPADRHHYQLLQNLSKTEIAKLIGSVRNVIERHIKDLKDQDIIESSRKNISIKNLEKLLEQSKRLLLN